MFPPQERDGHRLVDAIALVPVPTASVIEDGADIVVSVNLLGAETLDAWPDAPSRSPRAGEARSKDMLDTMLEVMDLSQLDTSVRHAGLADVVDHAALRPRGLARLPARRPVPGRRPRGGARAAAGATGAEQRRWTWTLRAARQCAGSSFV